MNLLFFILLYVLLFFILYFVAFCGKINHVMLNLFQHLPLSRPAENLGYITSWLRNGGRSRNCLGLLLHAPLSFTPFVITNCRSLSSAVLRVRLLCSLHSTQNPQFGMTCTGLPFSPQLFNSTFIYPNFIFYYLLVFLFAPLTPPFRGLENLVPLW